MASHCALATKILVINRSAMRQRSLRNRNRAAAKSKRRFQERLKRKENVTRLLSQMRCFSRKVLERKILDMCIDVEERDATFVPLRKDRRGPPDRIAKGLCPLHLLFSFFTSCRFTISSDLCRRCSRMNIIVLSVALKVHLFPRLA